MRRRTWVIAAVCIAAGAAVGAISLVLERDPSRQARELLHELDRSDPVLNAPPPEGAVDLRRFGFDACWNVDSGPSEPFVMREYAFDGDAADFREHYEALLLEHGWADASSALSDGDRTSVSEDQLLFYRKVFDEITTEFRLVKEDGTYRLGETVDYEFCEDEQ